MAKRERTEAQREAERKYDHEKRQRDQEQQRRVDEKRAASRAGTRTRNWAAVIYPESAPEDWRELLDDQHVAWIESPLHDRDVNPTGEPKKPHWHIVLMFDNVKTADQVKDMLHPLNCPAPIACQSVRGTVRYMAHLDNPEKAQYSKDQIIGHGGANPQEYFALSDTELVAMQREILMWVIANKVTEFHDLVAYAMFNREEWFDVLMHHSFGIMLTIKSQRHSGRPPVNPETGEAIGIEAEGEETKEQL